jgi:DHA1 family multidrug resistance protein-like MFS transporter
MIFKKMRAAIQTPWRRTVYIIFFAQLMTSVGFSSIFPFLPHYVNELGSNTGLSIELLSALVYSVQAFTMMIASPFWGAFADRYGRKIMVLRAMFGGTIVLALMAFVRSAEELIFMRAVQGVVTGTISAANALVAAETPRDRIGYAMGLMQVGQAGGVALGPVIGGVMADLIGYRGVFYFTAALLLISGILVLYGVKENVAIEPEDGEKRQGIFERWKSLLQTPGVLMTYSLRFSTRLGHLMVLPMIPLFLAVLTSDKEYLNTLTGLVIGSAFITNAIASAYLGRLSDKIGSHKILIVSAIVAGLLYLPQAFVTSGWQLVLFQALFGITLGGMTPALSALLARYSRVGQEGVAYGLDNSIVSGARTIAPLIGAGVAVAFGLRATFIFTAITFFLSALLAIRLFPSLRTGKAHEEAQTSKS